MRIYIYICLILCVRVCVRACVRACVCEYMYVCMCMYVCMFVSGMQVMIEIILGNCYCLNNYNSSKVTRRFVHVTLMRVQFSYTLMELIYCLHLKNIILCNKF